MIGKEAIEATLYRIRMVRRQFGTITDKAVLYSTFSDNQEINSQPISKKDILIFRRVVSTGVLRNKAFQPPNGYRILDFLMALQELQDRQHCYILEKTESGIVESMAELWTVKIERLQSLELAKAEMKAVFSDPDEYTTSILNQAYLKAKQQWENKAAFQH